MTTSTRNVKPVQGKWKMSKGLQPGNHLPIKKSRKRKYPKLTKTQQRLVEEHIWIAGRLAHSAKFLTGGFIGCYTKEDLESIASFALCVAASKYKPELGWKFSTYAWSTCRGWIQHALRDHSRLVRIPRWMVGVRKEVREMVKKGYSYEEISEELDLDYREIAMCEESWQEIHASYDHTPDDSRPKEFTYQVDEVKVMIGPDIFEKIGDFPDDDIKLLLQHVEGLLETEEERDKAEMLLEKIRSLIE